MSSYYTTAQLEAARKARLKRDLASSIQQLKEQLQNRSVVSVQTTSSLHVKTAVFAEDNSTEWGQKIRSLTTVELPDGEETKGIRREEYDFSGLLQVSHKPSKLEEEFELWIKRADERPVLTEKDAQNRMRLETELARIISDASVDIEDKVRDVKMRVSSYLQGAAPMTADDRQRIELAYYEYCALCTMLEEEPTERWPYRIESEISRMTGILEKRKQDEYIMENIESILGELGCHVRGDAVLDHVTGQMYTVADHPLCDVFVGSDGSGILFEPVGESKSGSLEKQRQIEDSASSICSLYSLLEERAADRGIILKRVYIEPPHINQMYMQSDVSMKTTRRKQKKNSVLRQKTFDSEG